jgi:hypothetical protein
VPGCASGSTTKRRWSALLHPQKKIQLNAYPRHSRPQSQEGVPVGRSHRSLGPRGGVWEADPQVLVLIGRPVTQPPGAGAAGSMPGWEVERLCPGRSERAAASSRPCKARCSLEPRAGFVPLWSPRLTPTGNWQGLLRG